MGQNRGDTNDAWILWDLNTGTTRNKTRAAHSNSVVKYSNSQKVGDEETTNELSRPDFRLYEPLITIRYPLSSTPMSPKPLYLTP